METHSSIHAWKILWREEPGQLQSMGSQRIRHDWATEHTDICSYSEWKTGHPSHVTHLLSSASSLGFHGLGDQRSLAHHCIPDWGYLFGWGWALWETEQTLPSFEGGRKRRDSFWCCLLLWFFLSSLVAPSILPWVSPAQIPFCVPHPTSLHHG